MCYLSVCVSMSASVCVCVACVIVKRHGLPPCVVDEPYKNPLYDDDDDYYGWILGFQHVLLCTDRQVIGF